VDPPTEDDVVYVNRPQEKVYYTEPDVLSEDEDRLPTKVIRPRPQYIVEREPRPQYVVQRPPRPKII